MLHSLMIISLNNNNIKENQLTYCKIKPVLIAFLALTSSIIRGDNRSYVWTYEYKIMERGKAEFEHYLTFKAPKMDSLAGSVTTVHNIEFEFGMNDKFDFSIYQNFEQPADGAFQYSGYKLRARYKLGEKNQYFMDPLLYFEYKGKPDFTKHVLEGKLILAKDYGSFNYAINPVFEIEYEDGEQEHEFKYNAGSCYKINELLRIGLEIKGGKNGHYLGPVISHGKDTFWVALGSAFAFTEIINNKPEFMLRMILGIHL